MKKRSKRRPYRALRADELDWSALCESVRGECVVVGIDVAKTMMFAVLMDSERSVLQTLKWEQPSLGHFVVGHLARLPTRSLSAAMEPSGVYGDPLRHDLWKAQIAVHRVSGKRSHDFSEVYDGVPSGHDAKAAAVVAYLHSAGFSELWPLATDAERTLKAAVTAMTMWDGLLDQARNRVEARLSRHWPEVTRLLDLASPTLLELLAAFGGPAEVAEHASEARQLMKKIGRSFLTSTKIEEVLQSAKTSGGVRLVEEEARFLRELAMEARRLQGRAKEERRRVESLVQDRPGVMEMGKAVGLATAAVLVATGGDPTTYPSAASWVKSLGLNLKERSSGRRQGQLAITKRGPGLARKYLFLVALRWLKDEPIVRAWYEKKRQRDGGPAKKALVAIMRKAARGLWCVAQGEPFDARRLFDADRLDLTL